jgi:hypothetical protein
MPFNHDWTRIEEAEYDGYRYGDIHWKPGSWAPGTFCRLSDTGTVELICC